MFHKLNLKFIKLNPYTLLFYFVLLFILLFDRKNLTLSLVTFIFILLNIFFYIDINKIKKNIIPFIIIFSVSIIFNFIFIQNVNSSLKSTLSILYFILIFIEFNFFIDDAKIFHIFYKFLPKTALVLSIAIRYNYLIIKKYTDIVECFKANNETTNSLKQKFNNALDIFLSITNSSIEDSIVLSKSIKSKSYLTYKRTYFNFYSVSIKDIFIIVLLFSLFYFYYFFNLKLFVIIIFITLPVLYDCYFYIWRLIRCHILA